MLTITPHGNGTHTESVAHLADGGPSVPALLAEGWMPAWLASVAVKSGAISPETLADALADAQSHGCAAFILRTRPNDAGKLARRYDNDNPSAFLTAETAAAIADADITHLLVDLPSLDRLDDPALPAHRAFFGLPAGSHNIRDAKRRAATVTEFIYAPDEIADGLYLLDLQVPRWQLEAVPSRPLVTGRVAMTVEKESVFRGRSAALVPAPTDALPCRRLQENNVLFVSLPGASPKPCGARAHPTGLERLPPPTPERRAL